MTILADAVWARVMCSILKTGTDSDDRTGVGTRFLTNQTLTFNDIEENFPLIQLKKIPFKLVAAELLWFLEGGVSDRRLAEITYNDGDRSTIWTGNALKQGVEAIDLFIQRLKEANCLPDNKLEDLRQELRDDRYLGPVYGAQWRSWSNEFEEDVDQIKDLIERIKANPADRRMVVSAWNPAEIPMMALPPCHMMFQINVRGDRLDMAMFQRSADMFLGIPFNIASYALLLKMIAKETGYKAGNLLMMLGNAHIYHNHFDQVEQIIERRNSSLKSMKPVDVSLSSEAQILRTDDGKTGYSLDDFKLIGYNPLSTLSAPMAV